MRADGPEARAALAISTVAIAAATWLILVAEPEAAGWCVAVSAFSMALASVEAHHDRARFLGAVLYRVFDAAVLGAVAWELRSADAALALAALVALVGGFLAAYFAAKGRALGYSIEASTLNRFLRIAFVATALLTGQGAWLWACAALSVSTAIVRGGQAFKEEMA